MTQDYCYSVPVGECYDERARLSVCLRAYLHISTSSSHQIFVGYMLPMAVAPILLWLRSDSGFVDDGVFFYDGPYGPRRCRYCDALLRSQANAPAT